MRYNKIRQMDISNGPGVRVSIFMQGCTFKCKECFNPETHDFKGGKELTDEVIEHLLDICGKDHIEGLSILGGEPLHPKNVAGTTRVAKAFKEKYPNKTIWIWSGFTYEDYLKDLNVLNYVDVIVDGQFVDELRNPNLRWKGSSNQRVIDIKKTLKKGNVVLFEE